MLFRFIFLLLVLFFSPGSYAAWCNKDCSESCKKDYIQDKGYQNLQSIGNSAYACSDKYSTTTGGSTIRAKIGWSDTCAIPSGDNIPSKSTCLTTHNLLGKVIDTFLTLGIAVAMFEQFCSFSAGDPNLEGAVISNSFLSKCSSLQHVRHKKRCMSCIFQGLSYDGTNHVCSTCTSGSDIINSSPQCQDCLSQGTGASCTDACQSGVCITSNVNNHLVTGSPPNICNGIPNFDKPVVNSIGEYAFDTDTDNNKIPVYCPLMRCNVPTNDIITKYYDKRSNRTAIIGALAAASAALALETGGFSIVAGAAMTLAAALTGDCCDIDSIQNGTYEHVGFWGAVNLKGETDGDRICAQMLMPDGYTTVACKFRVPPPVVYPPTKCTLSNTACVYGAHTHGLWIMPITSTIMECVSDIMGLFFEPNDGSSLSCPTNHLFLFQANLRNIVRIMLILYVVIFGINLAFSSSPIKKGEIFSFIFKFALVTYFSVGTFTVTSTEGAGQFDAKEAKSIQYNGLEYLNKLASSVMNSFAGIIINASGWSSGSGVAPCVFDPNDARYQNNGKDYSYLFLWDSLDCHLAFYLGLASPTSHGLSSINQGSGSIASKFEGAGIAALVLPAFFSMELFLLIFVIAFTVFLFSIVVYFTNLYIVAMLAVAVLIFFGPFFIPMALFKYTRGMFDKWVNLLFGYALQPAVISGFLALFITTFYMIFYSGCTFTSLNAGGAFPYWSIEYPASEACKNSLGYITAQLNPDVAFRRIAFAGGLFYYKGLANNWLYEMEGILDSLMLCTFFAFLFYYFAEQLSGLAADLTGSMVLGNVVSPNAITDLAVNKIGSKFSEWREKRNQKQAPKTGRQGINVSSVGTRGISVSSAPPTSSRGGVSVSSTSGSAAVQSNSAAFKAMPFASGGDTSVAGSAKSSREESAQSNRAAFQALPFGQEAHAYDEEQSNRSSLQSLPFAGMDDVKDRKKAQVRSNKAANKGAPGSGGGGGQAGNADSSQSGSTARSGTSGGSSLGGAKPKSPSPLQGGSSAPSSGVSGGGPLGGQGSSPSASRRGASMSRSGDAGSDSEDSDI